MEEYGISSFIVRAIAFVIFLFMLAAVGIAFAEPTHKAKGEGVEIVIYSEPCALKEVVQNLPQRATWHEGSKVYEGCGGFHPMGVALFYFTDKTVVPLPVSFFVRVVGA